MAGSLFDQLKKSGLVDDKKAKQIKKQKYQQSKQNKGKKGTTTVSEAAQRAEKAAQQKQERDRQLNLERQQAQDKRANEAAVKQVLEANRLKGYEGEVAYNFVDDNVVKTLNVSSKIHKQLVSETLRVARFKGGYVLLPLAAVEKVKQRDESVLIPISDESANVSDEDKEYYAQFEVPDDLVW